MLTNVIFGLYVVNKKPYCLDTACSNLNDATAVSGWESKRAKLATSLFNHGYL